MFVGVGRFVLHIPSAQSLKQRRQVVRSCKDRIRAKLPVSIAEVGDVERLQVAELGVAVVSADATRCDEILGAARSMMSQLREAVLADVRTELIALGEGGKGIAADAEPSLNARGLAPGDDLPEHWSAAFPVDAQGADLGRGAKRDQAAGQGARGAQHAGRDAPTRGAASKRRGRAVDSDEYDADEGDA